MYFHNLSLAGLLHRLEHGHTELSRRITDSDASSLESPDFVGGSTLATSNDGASVAHATSGGSSDTSNEANDGLLGAALLNELSRFFFSGATDLTNDDDALSLGILDEELEGLNEVGAVEGVSSNTNANLKISIKGEEKEAEKQNENKMREWGRYRLAKADGSGLVDGLVGQSTRARDDT